MFGTKSVGNAALCLGQNVLVMMHCVVVVFQFGVEYCRSVKSLVKNDFTIYALVHCMILFDPRDAKIVDRQLVNQTRDKYVIMLKHYLESQYSYLYADEYFVAIQELVREMCHMAQSGNAFFKRYSSAFQPLITEMLSST